jgi:hypothetical protein
MERENLMHRYHLSALALVAVIMTLAPALSARNKTPKAPVPESRDGIQVAAHIPPAVGPVLSLFATQQDRRYYLYAGYDRGSARIDITDATRPSAPVDIPYSAERGSGSLAAVAGTSALVATGSGAPAAASFQTIRIMDFSDPQKPKVAQEFEGVTATSRDDRRGLIFVANKDGIWILRQSVAVDPEVEKAYADYVLYSH